MARTAFSEFDLIAGGLMNGDSYLLYGPAGTGKTTFALGFVHEGVREGQSTLMVTASAPRLLLEQARSFGFELEEAVRDGRLILFEYPENIRENARRLVDDTRVAEELLAMLGGRSVKRVVFDPVSPLLAAGALDAQSARLRELQRGLQDFGATTLFVVDTPEGEADLNSCREALRHVIRFDAGSAADPVKSIRLERFPGQNGVSIPFELIPGQGFAAPKEQIPAPQKPIALLPGVPAPAPMRPAPMSSVARPPAESEWAGAAFKVLVVESDRPRRAAIKAMFDDAYHVVEAQSAADGLMMAAAEGPDLIIVNVGLRSVTGPELIRRLRNSGNQQPVIAIGEKLRRTQDHVDLLLAGASQCYPLPLDGRLLRLAVGQLLLRTKASADGSPEVDEAALRSPVRQPLSYTAETRYFLERVDYETEWAARHSVPFHIVSMRAPSSADLEGLALSSVLVTRSSDVTLVGARGLLVLLTESSCADGYLGRFRQRWSGGPELMVDIVRFEQQAGFASQVRDLLSRVAPPSVMAAGAGSN